MSDVFEVNELSMEMGDGDGDGDGPGDWTLEGMSLANRESRIRDLPSIIIFNRAAGV